MTISTTVRTAGPFSGNDVSTLFAFAFKVFTASDVYATVTNAFGIITVLNLGTDYTVTLNADQNAHPGGTITLVYPLATGNTLNITSAIDYLQSLDIPSGGAWSPAVINDALDKMTIWCQQLKVMLDQTSAPMEIRAVTGELLQFTVVNGIVNISTIEG